MAGGARPGAGRKPGPAKSLKTWSVLQGTPGGVELLANTWGIPQGEVIDRLVAEALPNAMREGFDLSQSAGVPSDSIRD